MNEGILTAVEMLLFVSQPMLGKWLDPAALAYQRRLEQLNHQMRLLRAEAKALDLLVAVPGV